MENREKNGLHVVEVGLVLAHRRDNGGQGLEKEVPKLGVHGGFVETANFFGDALNGKNEALRRHIFSGNGKNAGDGCERSATGKKNSLFVPFMT